MVKLVICVLVVAAMMTDVAGGACENSTVDTSPAFGPARAAKAKAFLVELRHAVKQDDRKKVASMVRYPLTVSGGKRRTIRTRAQFVSGYAGIITGAVKQSVLNQDPECLFGNDRGAMIGRGSVWFEERPAGFAIFAINLSAGDAK